MQPGISGEVYPQSGTGAFLLSISEEWRKMSSGCHSSPSPPAPDQSPKCSTRDVLLSFRQAAVSQNPLLGSFRHHAMIVECLRILVCHDGLRIWKRDLARAPWLERATPITIISTIFAVIITRMFGTEAGCNGMGQPCWESPRVATLKWGDVAQTV